MSEQTKQSKQWEEVRLAVLDGSMSGCSVLLLPELGGKIASIQFGGHELLQAPLAPYALRTQTMGFDVGDASGWDECLPSVAACSVQTAAGEATIPDHGDLWRVPWSVLSQRKDSVTLSADCFSLPLRLERTVALTQANGSIRLQLDYRLTNVGAVTVPWAWAAHPLFATEAGDRVRLPESIRTLRVEGSGGDRLGRSGTTVGWPLAELAAGGSVDLSLAQAATAGVGDKLFAGLLAADEGWCVLERPSIGARITTRFDPAVLPYLGLWLCAGGWPDRPGAKQLCAALEPTTAPVDSLALPGAWQRKLAPAEQACWQMVVELESLK